METIPLAAMIHVLVIIGLALVITIGIWSLFGSSDHVEDERRKLREKQAEMSERK